MNTSNPALEAFVASFQNEIVLAQVLVRRVKDGFELRHERERDAAATGLREVAPSELRTLAQFTESGAFRPLKAAPNLPGGWRAVAKDSMALEAALQNLYPGALADWFATRQPSPPITNYREFTNRQTGMYRLTQMLTDEQTAEVAGVCCHAEFCLKRRLWSVPGLLPDDPEGKSLIPCLEPCAVLLEFARKAMRLEQAEKITLSVEDAATVIPLLEQSLSESHDAIREADFNDPMNPRRRRLLLHKLRNRSAGSGDRESD